MKTLLKPLSFIPALLLMYMIFSFSGQAGDTSSDLSFRVSRKIVSIGNDVLGTNLTEDRIDHYADRINGFVRKLAHVTEYFALAVAVSFPLYVYGLRGILLMLVAGAFCVAFACGDEFHQSFVSGRTPSRRDVLIDSIGIFLGIIVVRMVGWTGRMTIFRSKPQPSPQQSMPYSNSVPPENSNSFFRRVRNRTSPRQPSQENPDYWQGQRTAPYQESKMPPYQQRSGNPAPQAHNVPPYQQRSENPAYQGNGNVPPYGQAPGNASFQTSYGNPYSAPNHSEMHRRPYVANFDPEDSESNYEYEDNNEYEDDDEPISGKPLRLFHYDDEYEEEEVEEEKKASPKLRPFSFKKHKS